MRVLCFIIRLETVVSTGPSALTVTLFSSGAFLRLKEVVSASPQSAATELLLVTGSGPKGRLDSLSALERLAREDLTALPAAVALAVAFNPFFPASDDNEEETARLRRKLATGLVAKV